MGKSFQLGKHWLSQMKEDKTNQLHKQKPELKSIRKGSKILQCKIQLEQSDQLPRKTSLKGMQGTWTTRPKDKKSQRGKHRNGTPTTEWCWDKSDQQCKRYQLFR
jgi:hypothetical protein